MLLVSYNSENTGTASCQPSSVTYNGVAMTLAGQVLANNPSPNWDCVGIYYLLNPANGIHAVSITFTAAPVNDGIAAAAMSIYSVSQNGSGRCRHQPGGRPHFDQHHDSLAQLVGRRRDGPGDLLRQPRRLGRSDLAQIPGLDRHQLDRNEQQAAGRSRHDDDVLDAKPPRRTAQARSWSRCRRSTTRLPRRPGADASARRRLHPSSRGQRSTTTLRGRTRPASRSTRPRPTPTPASRRSTSRPSPA